MMTDHYHLSNSYRKVPGFRPLPELPGAHHLGPAPLPHLLQLRVLLPRVSQVSSSCDSLYDSCDSLYNS